MKMVSSNTERTMMHPLHSLIGSIMVRKVHLLTSLLFAVGSFFLAQAVLFDAAVPFLLPVWALAVMRYPKYMIPAFVGGMSGSLFLGLGQALLFVLQLLLFNVVIRHSFTRKSVPLTVAATIIAVQVFWQLIMYAGQPPLTVQLSIGFEALLALVMTIFLFIAFPPVDKLLYSPWRAEQLGAACIIAAMAATGMDRLMIGLVSVPGALLYMAILIAAVSGGILFSTTVAMMIAAITGMAELSFTGMMTVYGMTGFAAGAMKGFGKLGVATGGLFASVFFLLYDLTLPLDQTHFVTIGAATLLFFCIPSKRLASVSDMLQPERQDLSEKRQQWLARQLDEQLTDFQQFASFMSTMVNDQFPVQETQQKARAEETPIACRSCFRYAKCWESNDDSMPALLSEWESTYSATKKAARHRVEEKIRYKCVRHNGLIEELEERGADRLLMGQLQHGRKMLALQLRDMSNHLEKMMKDIKEDVTVYQPSEEELGNCLRAQDIEFFQIDILSEEKGSMRIVCSIPERRSSFETDTTVAERLILPILEEMYQEPFQVEKAVMREQPFTHLQLTFTSAVRFSMQYGVVATAGGGSLYAGDAYEVFPIHDGLTAVLLSDGMGQDLNAYYESQKVIRLMRECLDRKMGPETAMHTLHYMMALNGLDDMYATLDLALIDLQDGRLWSWKAGSMSTYIKRGDEFLRVDSKAVPFGFLPSFTVEAKNEELKSGDIIVMMTDGIFNGDIPLEQQERSLCQTLERHGGLDCEALADRIMGEMERKFKTTADDRTVLVMKMDHIVPSWSSVKVRTPSLFRQKVVV
ncbi:MULTISPECIES: SpoIIE family protein phosphatase [Sporosarcina]|uniref:SpoIIE family protein phosphatase n=1 Tax=Sporosarcina TaxID=1569 RepID=UPI0006942C5E|nr:MULTISPECIES: SpoIIE family protein phosphatase [Sporosarcina]WJY26716.1 SpoIIE family protein phosphatase [Sporosarcina sp. 0.2-SM1T-5]